ncbi:hypothetical protein FRC09_017003 [Ceratobasidium sp. 395]|nr:hypothetical protein FRC09_017003 [Ceratobasidium sp. 395]
MCLEGPITNDTYLRAICSGYDEVWFGTGGYEKFVADTVFDIDMSEYGLDEPASPPKAAKKSADRVDNARYVSDGLKNGLKISSMGPPKGSPVRAASSIPVSLRDTSLPRAAVQSALLHKRIEPADASKATTVNPSTPANSSQVSPKSFSPPSLSANATNTSPSSPAAPVRLPPRSGVLPPLLSPSSAPRPLKLECSVDLKSPSPKAVKPHRLDSTKAAGAERTGKNRQRTSY